MGYELKLKVGWLSSKQNEVAKDPEWIADMNSNPPGFWQRHAKGKDGKLVYTKRTEQTFFEVASVDLCKIYDSATYEVARKSVISTAKEQKAVKNVIKWFDNGHETETDNYGDMMTPIPLKFVIEALEKDSTDEYRRFKWALALCKSIQEGEISGREFVVLFEGH